MSTTNITNELTNHGLCLCRTLDCEPIQLSNYIESKLKAYPTDLRPTVPGVLMNIQRQIWLDIDG